MINARLAVIEKHINEQPNITDTYFLPDNKKAGGRYVTVSGKVKKLDGMKCAIIMTNGTKSPSVTFNISTGICSGCSNKSMNFPQRRRFQ